MAIRNPTAPKNKLPLARILLVDDNANGLSARRCVLEELGYRIQTASSGADALEQFGAQSQDGPGFDLVVTDYKMPSMDGLELIVRLREQAPAIAIIMISGYTDTLGLDEKSTGADAVIQKSSNEVSHLVRAVSRLLKKRPAERHRIARKPAAAAGALSRAKKQGS